MTYSVTCQYAHHDHSESEDLGNKRALEVLQIFDQFPWSEQVEEANRLEKCSPTLSVDDKANRRLIWVSAYGAAAELVYVSECSFPGMKKALFGLIERTGIVAFQKDGFTQNQARLLIRGTNPCSIKPLNNALSVCRYSRGGKIWASRLPRS